MVATDAPSGDRSGASCSALASRREARTTTDAGPVAADTSPPPFIRLARIGTGGVL
jgi:hypothetical protein